MICIVSLLSKVLLRLFFSVFRRRSSSPWSNTLRWSSTTPPRTRGGATHSACGSLSPPRSWFPSSWFTIWASLPAPYCRYTRAFPRVCTFNPLACSIHNDTFVCLSEVLHFVHSGWRAVFERTREESPGTVRFDHASRHHGVLSGRCYFTWTQRLKKTTTKKNNAHPQQWSFPKFLLWWASGFYQTLSAPKPITTGVQSGPLRLKNSSFRMFGPRKWWHSSSFPLIRRRTANFFVFCFHLYIQDFLMARPRKLQL